MPCLCVCNLRPDRALPLKRRMQTGPRLSDPGFDLLLNSSVCQPLSGANPSALGWDDPRMKSFIASCDAKAVWKLANPRLQSVNENVVPARHLGTAAVMAELDRRWGHKHEGLNAKYLGGTESRPRIFAVDFFDIRKLNHSEPPEINNLLDEGWRSIPQHSPCVVASERTHNSPMAIHARSQIQRQYNNHEALNTSQKSL